MLTLSLPIIAIPIAITIACLSFMFFRQREAPRDLLSMFLFGTFEMLLDLVTAIPLIVGWMCYFAFLAYSRQ